MLILTSINWILLIPALFLLLWPADRLLSARVELRNFESFRTLSDSPRHRPWWWVPVLWLDPLRGLGGTLLLKHALALGPLDGNLASFGLYAAMLVVLVIAVLSQLLTRREEGALLAPLGFVAGMAGALTLWPLALVAFLAGLIAMFAFRTFLVFFFVGMVTLALFGIVFEAHMAGVGPAIGVFAIPILASFLSSSTLELPTRKDSTRASAQ